MKLNLPAYNFNIKREQNANYVFDNIRKKYVQLTPEEYVRQHLIHHLVKDLGYPASRIAVERGLSYNGLKKRFDLLVFGNGTQPLLMIECKAPDIALDQDTLMQVAVYNSRFGCPFLLITNGMHHVWVHLRPGQSPLMHETIPTYVALNQAIR